MTLVPKSMWNRCTRCAGIMDIPRHCYIAALSLYIAIPHSEYIWSLGSPHHTGIFHRSRDISRLGTAVVDRVYSRDRLCMLFPPLHMLN
ncbi:hypothetical protein Y032_1689g3941 [Ancylostoma ceylanicum]|uniref:Uncharacterized protein n=1 Tax=Ancylostoma ceylanicum TaxID=53326 RepID=A0A016W542_9BILA|nr:hypothetical protein Y032_1689g3941 [Ancylostoma ceylanicum]